MATGRMTRTFDLTMEEWELVALALRSRARGYEVAAEAEEAALAEAGRRNVPKTMRRKKPQSAVWRQHAATLRKVEGMVYGEHVPVLAWSQENRQ